MCIYLRKLPGFFFLLVALTTCKKEEEVKLVLPDPTITGFTPISGQVGTVVTITGTNFSTAVTSNTVTFAGKQASITSAAANQIVATVPDGATTGNITVNVNGAKNTAESTTEFTVNP
jgi:uncharacterized protein (TIGR03437 family)